MNEQQPTNEAACGGSALTAVLGAAPTKTEIASRLRALATEMEWVAAAMDYYGGFAYWASHGREIAGAGRIAREWARDIETANGQK